MALVVAPFLGFTLPIWLVIGVALLTVSFGFGFWRASDVAYGMSDSSGTGNSSEEKPIGGLLVLTIRGFLLWLIVPLGWVAWILASPWLFKRRVSVGQFLGWIDINLIVLIQRGLLRPLYPTSTTPWIPPRDISRVKHRVHVNDLL